MCFEYCFLDIDESALANNPNWRILFFISYLCTFCTLNKFGKVGEKNLYKKLAVSRNQHIHVALYLNKFRKNIDVCLKVRREHLLLLVRHPNRSRPSPYRRLLVERRLYRPILREL